MKNDIYKDRINQIKIERLNEIINDLKNKKSIKNKEEFAASLGYQPGTISRYLSGDRNITENAIDRICDVYKEYRKEYLLGIDDFKTEYEYLEYQILNKDETLNALKRCIFELIKINGIHFRLSHQISKKELEILNDFEYDSYEQSRIIDFISESGYFFQKDDRSVRLSFSDIEKLSTKICDYVGFEMNHLMHEATEDTEDNKYIEVI